jgi:hypothetical protein
MTALISRRPAGISSMGAHSGYSAVDTRPCRYAVSADWSVVHDTMRMNAMPSAGRRPAASARAGGGAW